MTTVTEASAVEGAADALEYPLQVTLESLTSAPLHLVPLRVILQPLQTTQWQARSAKELRKLERTLHQIARQHGIARVAIIHMPDMPDMPGTAPTKEQAPAPRAAAGVVTVVQDDADDFVVQTADGLKFRPQRNQVRDDGTLTTGGLQALAAARARSEA